jgi:transcriptional regulator with XRE-family HTH domain
VYGQVLRSVREAKGLKQADVAKAVGISPAHLARLESGKRRLYLDDFIMIAEALGDRPGNLLPNDLGTIGHVKPLIDRLQKIDEKLFSHIVAIVDRVLRLSDDIAAPHVALESKTRLTRKPGTASKKR